MHIFWCSPVYVSVLMFTREAFIILLSLMSLESSEKLTRVKIYLKPLKMSLLTFGCTLEEKSSSRYSGSHMEDPGLPHTVWMQKTQERIESLLGVIL